MTLIKQCHILRVLLCLNEYAFQDRIDVLGNKSKACETKTIFYKTRIYCKQFAHCSLLCGKFNSHLEDINRVEQKHRGGFKEILVGKSFAPGYSQVVSICY